MTNPETTAQEAARLGAVSSEAQRLGFIARRALAWATGMTAGEAHDAIERLVALASQTPQVAAGEVVAWAIFDSQGFYETREFEVEAKQFCDKYNAREIDPCKPYSYAPLYATPPAPAVAEPADDCVICPKCCHQFPAIPANVQALLAQPAGEREPLTDERILEIWRTARHKARLAGDDEIVAFARSLLSPTGITPKEGT